MDKAAAETITRPPPKDSDSIEHKEDPLPLTEDASRHLGNTAIDGGTGLEEPASETKSLTRTTAGWYPFKDNPLRHAELLAATGIKPGTNSNDPENAAAASARSEIVTVCWSYICRVSKTVASPYKGIVDPEDLAIEVAEALTHHLDGEKSAEEKRCTGAWIQKVARYKAYDQIKKECGRNGKKRRAHSTPDDIDYDSSLLISSDLSPEEHAMEQDTAGMDSLLRELGKQQREILRLRMIDELSAEEIAEIVGSTPVAVRVTIHRALRRLRDILAKRGITSMRIWDTHL